MINVRKAAVIGCGFVGASIAFSLMQKGIFSELVLIDANRENSNCLPRSLPSVISRLNSQWGIRGS